MKAHMNIETEVGLLEELAGSINHIDHQRLSELMGLLFEVQYPHIYRYKPLCHLAAISRLTQIRSGRPHPAEPANVSVGSGEVRIQVPPRSRCEAS